MPCNYRAKPMEERSLGPAMRRALQDASDGALMHLPHETKWNGKRGSYNKLTINRLRDRGLIELDATGRIATRKRVKA